MEPRAEEVAAVAADRLAKRGDREERDLRDTLERQRQRVMEKLEKSDRGESEDAKRFEEEEQKLKQHVLFEEDSLRRSEAARRLADARRELDEAKRQLDLNVRFWRSRLEQFDRDLEREPQRIREFYDVRATRVEPIGLVYLWPETN